MQLLNICQLFLMCIFRFEYKDKTETLKKQIVCYFGLMATKNWLKPTTIPNLYKQPSHQSLGR